MTTDQAKAHARRTIARQVAARVREADRHLLECVSRGDCDVETAATTSAAIAADNARHLAEAFAYADAAIDQLIAARERLERP